MTELHLLLLAIAFLAYTLLAVLAGWRLRRGPFQFRLSSLFLLTTGVALLSWLATIELPLAIFCTYFAGIPIVVLMCDRMRHATLAVVLVLAYVLGTPWFAGMLVVFLR